MSICPICLEDGAKIAICGTCTTQRYHPACITALEEYGVSACPTCRQACDLGVRSRAEKKQHACLRAFRVLAAAPFETMSGMLCIAVLVLVAYCMFGAVGAWAGFIYDVEANFEWIYPRDVHMNTSESFDLIRDDHGEVDDESWGGVVKWIGESPEEAPLRVVVTSGLTFVAESEFLDGGKGGDGIEDARRDIRVTPTSCFGEDSECIDQVFVVDYVHANFMRHSLDVASWQFALQALYTAIAVLVASCPLACFTLSASICGRAPAPSVQPGS